MNIEIITALLFGSMLLCLILGLPLAFSFGGISVIFMLIFMGPKALFIIGSTAFDGWTNYILLAIPLFILMANFLERSGIAEELYDAMYKWTAGLRGGLAIGTVIICAIFAAMSAVSSLATLTMGLIALPSMLKRGYDKDLCMGCIAAGGTLGILIPPSIIMVVYAAFTGESVGALFMGGVIPGIIITLIFIAYIATRAQLQPNLAPALESGFSWKEKVMAIRGLLPPFFLILLVLGIIYTGAATPTEAAGIGAFGAFVVLLLGKRLNWVVLRDSVARTFSITVMAFWIVLGAKSFTHIYVAIGAVKLAEDYIFSLGLNPWLVVISTQVILLFLGMFLDPMGIMLITIPIFVPLITSLGFDPVWFGILFTINMEVAFITPPFGFNLFYMRSIVEPMGFSMSDVYRAIIPFVFLLIGGLALIMIFPEMALWLPSKIMK